MIPRVSLIVGVVLGLGSSWRTGLTGGQWSVFGTFGRHRQSSDNMAGGGS